MLFVVSAEGDGRGAGGTDCAAIEMARREKTGGQNGK